MKNEYPKMLYKSREDYKRADSLEHAEKLLKDGYGDSDIMLRGKKPVPEPRASAEGSAGLRLQIPETKQPRAVRRAVRKNGDSK